MTASWHLASIYVIYVNPRSNDYYEDRPWNVPDGYERRPSNSRPPDRRPSNSRPSNRRPSNADNRLNYESEDSTDSVMSEKYDPPTPVVHTTVVFMLCGS